MKSIIYLLLLSNLSAHASLKYSAKRYEYESLKSASLRYQLRTGFLQNLNNGGTNPMALAQTYDLVDQSSITEWKTFTSVKRAFRHIRDLRYLDNPNSSGNDKRRISWLYPDDGCFARADQMMHLLKRKFPSQALPNKVFAFGNLKVDTENHPRKQVSWWYHVAPILRVGNQAYVLDPAIEPDHPLTLEAWIARMGMKNKDINLSICESSAYTPSSSCLNPKEKVNTGRTDQRRYLRYEYDRLVSLERNPIQELGDQPPWELDKQVKNPKDSKDGFWKRLFRWR